MRDIRGSGRDDMQQRATSWGLVLGLWNLWKLSACHRESDVTERQQLISNNCCIQNLPMKNCLFIQTGTINTDKGEWAASHCPSGKIDPFYISMLGCWSCKWQSLHKSLFDCVFFLVTVCFLNSFWGYSHCSILQHSHSVYSLNSNMLDRCQLCLIWKTIQQEKGWRRVGSLRCCIYLNVNQSS